jgi:signal transduction histidine kinase
MASDRFEPDLVGGLLGLIVHDLRNPLSALHSNASFLQSVRDVTSPDAKEALEDASYSVRVEFTPSADADVRLATSREMLGRALGNLIKNGIQHAQDGVPVRISAHLEGPRLVLLVEDGGAPVAADFRDKAFTAEGQVSAKGAVGARYSRGIGLFAARLAAEAAGAQVRAVPPPSGSGNAFELSVAR